MRTFFKLTMYFIPVLLLVASTVQARTLYVTASAYCACKVCCGANARGITASGLPLRMGMIAVDKRVIPLGTRVKTGKKKYLAADTGSAIRGRRIDVYIPSHKAALKFGRKKMRIEF